MRSSYEIRAQRFIRAIAPYLMDCNDLYALQDAILEFMADHPRRNISYDHGLTRFAIITSDYVIKIDYNEEEVARFGGGEKEIAFYAMAEREGMAHLFAKISRYTFNGRTYYIMPKVTGIDEDRWEDAWAFMTKEECEWCEDHNLYDLHCKNYGIMNGQVKIIDYGAYDDEE